MKQAFLIILLAISGIVISQEKTPLTHDLYESWEDIGLYGISQNGDWISYEINPYKGDGILYIENPNTNQKVSFNRGYKAYFSGLSDFAAFRVKPQADTLRKMKLDKVKKKDLPKDSLFIYTFTDKDTVKFSNIKSFNLADYNSNVVVILHQKEKKKKAKPDNSKKKKKKSKKKKKGEEPKKRDIKSDGTKLCIYYPNKKDTFSFDYVTDYYIDNYSNKVAFITQTTDSLDTAKVFVFDIKTQNDTLIFKDQGKADKVKLDEHGTQLAFVFSADTVKKKSFSLYYTDLDNVEPIIIADTIHGNLPKDYDVSPDKAISFSREKGNLFFGIRPKPINEPNDSILDEERCHVDIWSWTDKRVMPQQLHNLSRDKKKAYLTVYYPKTKKLVQLEDTIFRNVMTSNFKDAKYAIARVDEPYLERTSWDAPSYADFYLVNTETGEKTLLKKEARSSVRISPAQKYTYWFNDADSCWYAKALLGGTEINLTKNLGVNFYDEYYDVPAIPGSVGTAGWTKDDEFFIVYDHYDIWKIDPTKKHKAVNITKGRKDKILFRNIRLDYDNIFIDDNMFLRAQNKKTKEMGYYSLNLNSTDLPKQLDWGSSYYTYPRKAKKADKLLWRKMTTKQAPELLYSDLSTQNPKQLTNITAQQEKYIWCTSELTSWVSYSGDTLQGIIYKPENFDPNKKYPMMVYFYEKYSDNINYYYRPKPSRSTVNFTYYASNGYIVFVPDINYGTGHPGMDAYNAIVSGTEHMIKNSWVNKDKIGIQGQSWGGYQVAYLVTKTNMYACAEAGAPVSNMTSAYGGIRWGSGMSREFQYEKTQSRIGATLWERRDLYIENSPVFFADKVQTPLMIMHNDNDGAVPWYQGIEYFMALRRLQKPVWMVNYNGDSHNLMKKPNMIDLSIRLSQFFDYYLKDEPMPDWMNGVPALQKDKKTGFKLIE